jgi:flagellum-specific peptidoglycan hydrolase FlgJ
MTQQEFIEQVAKYVKKYAPSYNVKVYSPIIAQACLESAYGTSELAVNAHNYFGLKYNSAVSEKKEYIKVGSEQNTDGSYSSSVMKWCSFSSLEKGIEGYFKFLFARAAASSRYDNLKNVTDAKTYLTNIKNDGYATSLKYVENNLKVIEKWNLTQYDPTTTALKKYYRVQVGAFGKKENADKLIQQLKADGFSPILKYEDGFYKCQLNAFSNKANAELFLNTVKAKGYSAFIAYN